MQWGELNWRDIAQLGERVVVAPLGSLEQHGHHLPLLTDTMICSELARRAEAALGEEVLFLPVLWLGASDHHLGFAGTISLGNALYTQVIERVLESLITAGMRRILLLNAHGGNELPALNAIYEVQRRHRERRDLWLVLASWMEVASQQLASLSELRQRRVIHACELETSMILHLTPKLVRMEAALGARFSFPSEFYTPDFSASSQVVTLRPFDHISSSGAFGFPELATASKGETLFEVASAQVIALIREFARWPTLRPQ